MIEHEVKVYPSRVPLPQSEQLAYKIAQVACDPAPVDPAVAETVIDRLIDNFGVAIASLDRHPVMVARAQARAFPKVGGATVVGLPRQQRFQANWAGWANAVAVRELDFHDSFFGMESGHPGDNIAPILAVAQQTGRTGPELIDAIATAYEIQVDLCKGIPLDRHSIDHVGHLAPGVTAGLGRLLGLDVDTVYQAIQQAVHTAYATRQSRRGMMSSWKCYACAHAGKLAMEAIDRAMRGERGPSPIYEGEVSVIATMLGGPDAVYSVPLPERGEPKRAMLETFTKEHSVAYHGQAVIDLAFRMRNQVAKPTEIETVVIRSKRLTHRVTGSGANDPQKMDPKASRETLDHSVMFAFAVAFEDGTWHHDHSYAQDRVNRPETVALWQKVSTVEDPEWNARYEGKAYLDRAHGCRIDITMKDGRVISDEIHVANAHPRGAKPFARADYLRKFDSLIEGRVLPGERDGFVSRIESLGQLDAKALADVNIVADPRLLAGDADLPKGLF